MTTTLNASTAGAGGFIATGDNSGILALQTAGTTAVTIGTDQKATFVNDASISGLTVGKGGGSVATNTAVGASALNANTTATNNTAIGYQAGLLSTTANNAYIGYIAGYTNVSGVGNVYVGSQAGANATGGSNTFVGFASGSSISSGTKNTIIGGYNGNQDSLDIRTASNYVVLSDGDGNRAAFWQSGGGWVQKNNSTSWSTFSDQRIKKNIVSIEQSLEVISALRPVKFDYIQTGKHEVGFIAQEYETVLPEQIDRQYGIDDATKELVNDDHILSIQQNLVPYLVSAIQELKAINDTQAETINALTARIVALETA
jgi:hypothetical protein